VYRVRSPPGSAQVGRGDDGGDSAGRPAPTRCGLSTSRPAAGPAVRCEPAAPAAGRRPRARRPAGLPEHRASDVMLAVHELAANTSGTARARDDCSSALGPAGCSAWSSTRARARNGRSCGFRHHRHRPGDPHLGQPGRSLAEAAAANGRRQQMTQIRRRRPVGTAWRLLGTLKRSPAETRAALGRPSL